MNRPAHVADPRKRHTRGDLLSAFFSLALSRRYHDIRVADVLAVSGVGRSTFYEHFRNKDALLSASLDGPFRILAGMVEGDAGTLRVQGVLEHFLQNRALARSLFEGAASRVVRETLVAHVESCLDREPGRLRIPARLAAHSLADGIFSPIAAWLSGEANCDPSDLAIALRDAAMASVRALRIAER
ncbi:TetR/AcrR family transcriptional regulator [Pseudoxanthomonas putridarboris]|uniref:TetR/AcrR family transcriptional regulator n=1 Tax=Pseudoxanthomonas putridarboris TaxID=752605 RepID=A0ABU9J481_9GAMM